MQHELIKVHTPLTFSFNENPSTGYHTYIMTPEGIRIISDIYKAQNDLIGSGGKRLVTIMADSPGIYFISTVNIRPWEFEPHNFHIIKISVIAADDISQSNISIKAITK